MKLVIDYSYILLSIVFTVYGQIVLKWRMNSFGEMPIGLFNKIRFLLGLVFDPWVFSVFFAAFLASLAWMAAMTKFDLSQAYPFMSLNFVLVLLLSGWLLNEPITIFKGIGVILIVLGTIVVTRG